MIWLDYFLQTFVVALAWCLAVATVLAIPALFYGVGILVGRLHRARLERLGEAASRDFLTRIGL